MNLIWLLQVPATVSVAQFCSGLRKTGSVILENFDLEIQRNEQELATS